MAKLVWITGAFAAVWLLSSGPALAVAPTVISSCPFTIASPGYYATESALSATGDCIAIQASNVTLVMYQTITGNNTGTAIAIAKGATGAVVLGHGTYIQNFQNGIVDNAGGAVLGGFTFSSNTGTGLLLAGADSRPTMVEGVTATANGDGIHVTSAAGARMNGISLSYNSGHGLWFDHGSRNSAVAGLGGFQNGTQVQIDSSGNTVAGCELDDGQYGVVIKKGAGNNLIGQCGFDTGADASVADAIDHNKGCGSDVWVANGLPTGTPKCVRKAYPKGMIVLNACQSIEASGFYFVKDNLTATGDCFVVDAPNVMLFSKFRKVTGNGSGIGLHVMPHASGFRGGGLALQKFATGVEIEGDGALLEGSDANKNRDTGIFVNGAAGVTVGENGTDGNRHLGYHLLNASNTMIHNYGTFSNGRYGVFVEKSDNNLFDQFQAGDSGANGIAGFYIGCSAKGPAGHCNSASLRNVVTSGSAFNNTKYGYVIDQNSDFNVIANVQAGSNGIDDVYDGNANCANNVWWLISYTTSNNPGCMNQQ